MTPIAGLTVTTATLIVAIIGAVSLQVSIVLTYFLNRRNREAKTMELKKHIDKADAE